MEDDRTLSEPATCSADTRPQHLFIGTPAGTRRIRRMPSPQLFTQIRNFERLKLLAAGQWHPAQDDAQLAEISRYLHRCLVELDRDVLAFPGRRGLQVVLTWSAARRQEIADAAAKFMEV